LNTRPSPKLVTNETATLESTFQRLTFNLKAEKASVRHDNMQGRDFLVVPAVMMTEGVHRGSAGPLYYPAEELARSAEVWNSKPVVVYHPERNGAPISANDPDILTKYKVGELLKTRWEDNKLKTECWLEESRIRDVDDRVLNALDEGTIMEVSTGLLVDQDTTSGEWNGEAYDGIARNHRPDHFALLPDKEGACSVADGAGLLRNALSTLNENGPEARWAAHAAVLLNELSHSEIWQKLNAKISDEAWVEQVYDEFFVYHQNDKLWYQMYTIKDDDEITLDGVRQEATEVRYWKLPDGTMVGNTAPANLTNNSVKENTMDRDEVIAGIIGNDKLPWSEEQREVLNGMTDDQLKFLAANGEEPETPEPETPEPEPEPETPAEEKPTDNQSVEEFIANAPEGIRDMLTAGLTAHNAEKNGLVGKVLANKRNTFTKEQLNEKGLDELKALAVLATDPEPETPVGSPRKILNFAGQAEPAKPVVNAGEEEPLSTPCVVNQETEDK